MGRHELFGQAGESVTDGAWNGGKLRLGATRMWADAAGVPRWNTADPASITDGAPVADDSAVVHRSGDETVGGVKTFSGTSIFNAPPQVAQGSLAYHPVRRDDSRFTGDQAAGTASPRTLGGGALQAAPGNHSHAPTINTIGNVGGGGTVTVAADAFPSQSVHRVTATGSTLTVAAPTNPPDGCVVNVEVYASVAVTVTIAAAIGRTEALPATMAVPVGKVEHIALRYRGATPAGWRLLAAATDA